LYAKLEGIQNLLCECGVFEKTFEKKTFFYTALFGNGLNKFQFGRLKIMAAYAS